MPSVWPKSGRPYVSQLETDFRDDRIVLSTCFHNHPYFASFKHNLWKWAPIIINSRQLARSTIVLRAAKRQLLFLNLLWFLCVTQTIAVWWYYHHSRKDSWGFSDALAYLAGWLTGRLAWLADWWSWRLSVLIFTDWSDVCQTWSGHLWTNFHSRLFWSIENTRGENCFCFVHWHDYM